MKRFNDTGVCIPERHYMVDISDKITRILRMVEQGDYFVISRPNQYGKTTTIHILNRFLKTLPEYFPVQMSFEGIGSESFQEESAFIEAFMLRLETLFEISGYNDLREFTRASSPVDVGNINKLSVWITRLVKKIGKKVVLTIDEVDKSSNNQLFLDFLGMLREKYLKSNQGLDSTFHSVILVGVHDIKSLKIKLRPDSEARYNSPWNIAVDFDVSMDFSPTEITSMLKEYSDDRKIKLDIPFFAENLFYFTSGYPFLVSHLCKIIDEKILPEKKKNEKKKKEWESEDLVKAAQIALMRDNTNFETLIKNLENNPELYELVFKIIMNEREFSYNRDNPVIRFGSLYGILEEKEGKTKIHNRLYEQRIYNYMASKMETSTDMRFDHVGASYIKRDGALDLEKAIRKFQEFMKEQYSTRDIPFLERNGRLLFLAFIKPIINGRGYDFKEVEVSEEKRLDMVITFEKQKYIVELKIWRGEAYHREGIRQLCDYLDRQNQSRGYLLIYDLRKETGKQGAWEKIEQEGKEIYTAWI
jgi:hypothetical protein